MRVIDFMRRPGEKSSFHLGKFAPERLLVLPKHISTKRNCSHGLSYTSFKVSPSVTVTPEIFDMDRPPVATVQIKNTGKLAGTQTLQLYISAPESQTPRPTKELHGFEKVYLQPGEEKTVDIQLDRYATSFWDEIEDMWKSEQGTYEVLIGTSSQEVVAQATFRVDRTTYWRGL